MSVTTAQAVLPVLVPASAAPQDRGGRRVSLAGAARATGPLGGAARRAALAGLRADPRQAVQQDWIRCLICAASFRQLTNTHLRGHRLTADEYKRRFGYNRGRPLMCRALSRLYTERAVRNGLAARIRQRPILIRPELRRRGGTRTIALEELLTRREVRRRVREPLTAP
ncbi:MAG TPA: MucR family transcriptional regulator [Methylomirabilota bacterium]|jgi:predicted transcriptional regulator